MSRLLLPALLLSMPALAAAQTGAPPARAAATTQAVPAETGQPPKKVRDVSLAAGQSCPKAQGDEIVVCRTLEDPYRIPKQFRRPAEIPAKNQSWVNRAATMDQVGRVAGGLPDTCSPVGTGGQTGCALQQNQQWAADKRQQRREAESIP